MEAGVNPDLYPEWKMLNMGVSGIDPQREFYFVHNYAFNHAKKLKAVVFSLDIDAWRGVEDHLELLFDKGPGYIYDANHNFWVDFLPENFIEAMEDSYPAPDAVIHLYSERGRLDRPSMAWCSMGCNVKNDSVLTQKQKDYFDKVLEDFSALVDEAASKNIQVIGIIFPSAPAYKYTGAFGPYGLQRSMAKETIDWFKDLSKKKPNFHFVDENKMGEHDYTDEMAMDSDHLSYIGAKKMTESLNDVLKNIFK